MPRTRTFFIGNGFYADVIYSPDDGGYYAEITSRLHLNKAGQHVASVGATDVFPTEDEACKAAQAWGKPRD